MKKVVLSALIAIPLTVSACSGQDRVVIVRDTVAPTTQPEATTTTEKFIYTPTTVPYVGREDRYLFGVMNETTLGFYYTETQILSFGYMVCQYYDQGGTDEGLVEVIYNAGVANYASDDVMLAFA